MSVEYGEETVTLVEIDQPFCQLDYGTSPCTAQLGVTGAKKCYNTRATCQDAPNYDPLDITLRFSFSQEKISQYGYVIPSLRSVATTPMRLNIGSMDRDMSPFGERETVTLTFNDHQHSDLEVDKYRTEREDAHGQSGIDGFDPYENGSFWGKWLARNPFHEGYPVRILEGQMHQGESALRVRNYLIDKINGPTNGQVTIILKDLFSLIEERKAEAPPANTGRLDGNITAGATSLDLTPSGIGDLEYLNSGRVTIGDEIMVYTRTTGSDTLNLTTRGDLNTPAQAHDDEDTVQEVLVYDAERVDLIITDLLVAYTEIQPDQIPSSEWAVEVTNNLPTLYTAYIGIPTPVLDLIGELAEQVGFTLWPDVITNLIQLKAVGANVIPALTLDDDAWLMAGSLTINRHPDLRVSRVQVFYGQVNPLIELDDETNYRAKVETRDTDAEDFTEYGTKSIRKVFSRWIPQFGRSTATAIASQILKLFRDPPFRTTFDLDILRCDALELAFPFTLTTRSLVNDLGQQDQNTMLPMSISRNETDLEIESQKLNLFVPLAQERLINIDDDINDVNLKVLHDSLFSPAADGDEVTFIVASGVVVGSTSTSIPAIQTGNWPAGVILKLELESGVFLVGPGGIGGDGWIDVGRDGAVGGTALLVEFALVLINNGTIGGGGGGGGGVWNNFNAIGLGGGGGAGRLVGPGAAFSLNAASNAGSLETGGAGLSSFGTSSGAGGNLGNGGGNAVGGPGPGAIVGNGGLPGPAIDGDSLVTHESGSGTIIGSQIN